MPRDIKTVIEELDKLVAESQELGVQGDKIRDQRKALKVKIDALIVEREQLARAPIATEIKAEEPQPTEAPPKQVRDPSNQFGRRERNK